MVFFTSCEVGCAGGLRPHDVISDVANGKENRKTKFYIKNK